MIDIHTILHGVEIRGVEEKTNKNGDPYLIVSIDDERGKRSELLDKDLERKKFYKRGQIADITLSVSSNAKWTNIRIIDMKYCDCDSEGGA